MRIEIENDSMAQDGGRNGLNIVDAEVIAAAHERQDPSALD